MVDSEGAVGKGLSVDLDSTGQPHISYHDGTNLDLKYADYRGCRSVAGAEINGPLTLRIGQEGTYQADPLPLTASLPITLTWDSGAIGFTADYSWTMVGTHTLAVTTANPCGEGQGNLTVEVILMWPYRLFLPLSFQKWPCWRNDRYSAMPGGSQ